MWKQIQPKVKVAGSIFILWALALALYWPTIHAELVWDDSILVWRYHLLDMHDWFYNCFQRGFLSREYYRPLPLLTWMLNGLGGAESFPLWAHATNLFIFGLNLTLVVMLAWFSSRRQWWCTLLAGCIYVVHPALLEAIAWISGRCDLMVTFFMLLALLLDVVLKQRFWARVAAICLCFFCAALSKEMAVIFPAIWLVWRLYIEEAQINSWGALRSWLLQERNWIIAGALFLTGVVYLLFRFSMLSYSATVQETAIDTRNFGGFFTHFLLVTKTFYWYNLLQTFPHYDLSVVYPTSSPVSLRDQTAWLGFGLLFVYAALLLTKNISLKFKYALLAILILFLPIGNIKPIGAWDNFIHLRFLTLPISIGVILFVPLAVEFVLTLRKRMQFFIAAVACLWCLAAAANLMVTVPLWSKNLYLWKWVTTTKPTSYFAWENYSIALLERRDFQGCVDAELKSLELFDAKKPRTYLTLAQCYNAMNDRKNASFYAIKASEEKGIEKQKDLYSSVLTLFALWQIEDAVDADDISETRQRDIVSLLTVAIRQDPFNEHAPPLLLAWAGIIGDENLANDMAQLMYLRKFSIQSVQSKINNFNRLTIERKQHLNAVLEKVYAQHRTF